MSSDRRWGLLALLGSVAATSVLYAGTSLMHLDQVCIPRCAMDVNLYTWMFGWMHRALVTGQNPFIASVIGAPQGTPLYWVTSVSAQAFIATPLTALLGAEASYNIMVITGVALASWAVMLLCYEVVGRRGPAVAGGVLFWGSSYLAWEAVHMNLLFVGPLVLFARLVIRYAKGASGMRVLTFGGGLLLALQFYASTEIFASLTLFGAIAVGLYVMMDVSDRRVVAAGLGKGIAAAYGVCLLLIAPFLWRALQSSAPPARVLSHRSVDLLEIIVPSEISLLGVWASGLRHLAGIEPGYADSGVAGYLSVPMILLVIWFWRERSTFPRMLAPFVATVMVFGLGPQIEIFHQTSIPGPYRLIAGLPLLEHALPKRYPLYAWIAISVMLAIWLDRHQEGAEARTRAILWSLIGALVLFPGAQVLAPPERLPSAPMAPEFFASSEHRWFIEPDDRVLILAPKSMELRWHLASGFGFILSEGYLGPYAPWGEEDSSLAVPPEDPAALAALSSERYLDWIAMPSGWSTKWRSTLEALSGEPPIALGGIELYRTSEVSGMAVSEPSIPAQAAYRRAIAESLRGAFTDAAAGFRQVLDLRPTNRFAHMGLARLYIAYGSSSLAEVHLRAALTENPDFVEPLVTLARLWSSEGRTAAADALYRRAFLLRPSALTDSERTRVELLLAGGTAPEPAPTR